MWLIAEKINTVAYRTDQRNLAKEVVQRLHELKDQFAIVNQSNNLKY